MNADVLKTRVADGIAVITLGSAKRIYFDAEMGDALTEALSCDLRIAEDGDYLIGLPEANLGLLPGAGGTQRLPRTIGTPAALMHILMGVALAPREAESKGLVHETVSGRALDRAMEIAQRLSSFPPESVAYIKRLVRNATETPLAQGLALERNLFLKLCISDPALARMRSYEEAHITSPSRSIVVEARSVDHD
jgi:enoyl-CoA hydratase